MADSKKARPYRRTSMTPEEKIARAARARNRFKGAIRFVIQNLYWLMDIVEEELGDDVKKNIKLLTRKRGKTALTLMDKFILCKPTHHRTEEEKLRLDRVIGGLSCFRRYPRHVQRELAGVTRFVYFGPDRTVLRQGHHSDALYFIVSGTVTISQETFDPVLNETVTQVLSTSGPGSKFGEVALLHDIPRTATIVTTTHCEFLCLTRDDFNAVLKETVQQQWNDVKAALEMFTYFDNWDAVSIRECCILSKLNWYSKDETILGDGVGFRDYVYFILSGSCQVIENLHVTNYVKNGVNYYELYEPPRTETSEARSFQSVRKGARKSKELDETSSYQSGRRHTIISGTKSFQANPKDRKKSEGSTGYSMNDTSIRSGSKIDNEREISVSQKNGKSVSVSYNTNLNLPSISNKTQTMPFSQDKSTLRKYSSASQNSSIRQYQRKFSINSNRSGMSDNTLPPNVKTYFVQVCVFKPKGCFGIGEENRHRRVIAAVPTRCLLIPRYWLMQKGNIWYTVQHYVINHIPTTAQVFREFLKERRWKQYRKKLFNELTTRKLPNINTILNVPYYFRIHSEDFD